MIPLILKIKKETHKDIAQAQDIIVEELYRVFNTAVIHGGTAIWRCYGAQRFSEDIDVYIPKDMTKLDLLFAHLEKRGFSIEKRNISEKSLYSNLLWDRTFVRFEAIFRKTEGHLREYQTIEGNLITVYSLTPEEFIVEKVKAYLGRHKIRDLYDIFFLIRLVNDFSVIKPWIEKLKKEFRPPLDEKDLKVLILDGLVPTSEKMIEYLRNITWAK
ncbi:MAG TPA: nucleotidyl transferase AbiEii/AbiGii toxin family protein [Candidatus Nanoarchaeia archaeon]|nr:nucleotidyl transferase AbiEii/AbiGii toxin family protein [Candidatus Nanoarchaeia archaeon]